MQIKQMPFDSSKVKFHDEMDMFFRERDAKKPQDGPGKAVKQNKEKKDLVGPSDFQLKYEQKMREL